MDIFNEKIVRRKKTFTDYLLATFIVIVGFFLFIIVMGVAAIRQFSILLAAGVVYGVYHVIISRSIEFEYIVTNDELDIDRIVARKRRKRIFTASCKDFDILAKLHSEHYNPGLARGRKVISAVTAMTSTEVYFATLTYKGERSIVFFEPNEKMLEAFKVYIPKKLFL